MSHTEDSEDDIWEYKPIGKKKKTYKSFSIPKKHKCAPAQSSRRDPKFTEADGGITNNRHVPQTSVNPPGTSSRGHVPHTSVNPPGTSSRGHVPHTSVNPPGTSSRGHVPHTSVNHPGTSSRGHVPHTSVNPPGTSSRGHVPHTSVNHPGHISNGNVPHASSANPGIISNRDVEVIQPGRSHQESDTLCTPEPSGHGAAESEFCPVCQMPFSILRDHSPMGHVTGCLDIPRDDSTECPDGVQCSSNIPKHYRSYNHTLLAHSRAANTSVLFSLSQAGQAPGGSGVRSPSLLENSQDSGAFPSSMPNPRCHPSPTPTRLTSSLLASTPTQIKNALLLLRSPCKEDFKKKKGWTTPRQPKTKAAVVGQANPTVLSAPRDANTTPQSQDEKRPDTPELHPFDEDSISFSPLSELPAEFDEEMKEAEEVSRIKKTLFPLSIVVESEEESEDSLELFSDDHFLNDFLDRLEADRTPQHGAQQASVPVSRSKMEVVCPLAAPSNHRSTLSPAPRAACGSPTAANVQSPQSIVLERLRQTLNVSNSLYCVNNNNNNNSPTPGPSQATSSTSAQTMASRSPALGHGKAGAGPGLKQTDIGVFFGVKPLKEHQGEPGRASQDLRATTSVAAEAIANSSSGSQGRGSTRGRGGRGNRGARRRAAGPTGAQADVGTSLAEGGGPDSGQTGGRRRGSRGGGRSRWNRGGAYGDTPRNCPFYKKIPGTSFVIDAFSYGHIEGISSYFLTHFHSDHYGGLTRRSTVPIYCNKITGNLVRSKLRVEEQYLHILPMNTRVKVDNVEVILMEANHCPGAAMLLFFLPDGQIVLHTGDFRADPTMERYPELLGCRVQTLYLDTTYCSPEYSFPTQQEAIRFAANTAFEVVALHPRTLVVCGTYSIGKEKVFLALAEILGSKVCLSRDKYNTMCCLESEPITKLLTTDLKAGQVHVLSMNQLNVSKLQAHLSRFSAKYDRLLAFKPTGWTFSKQMDSMDDIQPQMTGNITVYGVPYSEHSSFLEMKRFVQWLRPLKIIPTVNVGSWDSRKAMEQCFRDWLAEDNTSH